MKKVLVVILALFVLCTTCCINVLALNYNAYAENVNIGPEIFLDAESKINFAQQKNVLYAKTASMCTFEDDDKRIEYITMLRKKVSFSKGSERQDVLLELENLGVYLYSVGQNNVSVCATENADVTIDVPLVYYNAWEQSWTVSCSGEWKNDDWRNDLSGEGNVGGLDGFGVGYYNTSGTYNTAVLRCSAGMDNGKSGFAFLSTTTSSRSDGNGRDGFGFQIQDKIVNYAGQPTFIGKRWYGDCTYNYNFTYYNGIATAYYVHTWNTATLTSVSFGVGVGQVSFGFGIRNDEHSFKGFSADKVF